jgi:small subunit ribosomal protein S17
MTVEAKKQALIKTVVGRVISDKMNRTIIVEVSRRIRHPRYQKVVTRFKKYYAHDELEMAGVGDKVLITQTRPLSRLKRWKLTEVLEKAETVEKVAS